MYVQCVNMNFLQEIIVVLSLLYLAWEIYWYTQVGIVAIKWHTVFFALVMQAVAYTLYLRCLKSALPLKEILVSFFSNIVMPTYQKVSVAAIAVIYTGLSIIIGETHPFTLMPMYSQFSNCAYTIKVTKSNGFSIPVSAYFQLGTGELCHKYYTVRTARNIQSEERHETTEELGIIGCELLEALRSKKITQKPLEAVQLHLVTYYLSNDSIKTEEKFMCERDFK